MQSNEWSKDYKSLKENSLILIKPNFIPCSINSIDGDDYHVTAFSKDITVRAENIIIPLLPVYNIQEVIQFLDEET